MTCLPKYNKRNRMEIDGVRRTEEWVRRHFNSRKPIREKYYHILDIIIEETDVEINEDIDIDLVQYDYWKKADIVPKHNTNQAVKSSEHSNEIENKNKLFEELFRNIDEIENDIEYIAKLLADKKKEYLKDAISNPGKGQDIQKEKSFADLETQTNKENNEPISENAQYEDKKDYLKLSDPCKCQHFFVTGDCIKNGCYLMHVPFILEFGKIFTPDYKLEPCKDYHQTGYCRRGCLCFDIHFETYEQLHQFPYGRPILGRGEMHAPIYF